jgi:hypothetical protein
MLQVISGKFYNEVGDITEMPSRGIIYSNTAYPISIRTPIATLELANCDDGIGSYVMEYVARFEQRPGRLRTLRIGESTIVEQFRLLALFFFKAYFSTSRDQVVRTCHAVGGQASHANPASYVRGFLNPLVAMTPESAAQFGQFVGKVLAMPRKTYEKVMDCLRCSADAIELAGYNMDLAYSMLVYCAEALSQGFDNFVPTWDDVSEELSKPLNLIFASVDASATNVIKNTLLAQQHFKLTQRFIRFTTEHLPDSFYTTEAAGLMNPIRPSELRQMLTNVYDARSKYVHTLKDIRNQLKIPTIGDGEVFHDQRDPYLTFNGMLRLVHTVVREFIRRQPVEAKEDYDWAKHLSQIIPYDVVELPPAPNYWIPLPQSAVPEISGRRLSGFLSMLFERQIPNMSAVVEAYINQLPTVASEKHRQHMALLCETYIYVFSGVPEVAQLRDKYASVSGSLNKPSFHGMVLHFVKGQDWPWPPEKAAELYSTYEKQRAKSEFAIPIQWEIILMLEIANQFDGLANYEKCAAWKRRALLEAAGALDLQKDIERSIAAGGRFHLNGLQSVSHTEEERKFIEESAYFKSLQRIDANESGDERSDWLAAEMDYCSRRGGSPELSGTF